MAAVSTPAAVDDAIIVRLKKDNPRREGTHGWRSWNVLTKGMTYAAYLTAGGRRTDLAWDLRKGNVKLMDSSGASVGLPVSEHIPFGGKRGNGGAPVVVDDSSAKRLRHTRGWKLEPQYRAAIVHVKDVGQIHWRETTALVFVSPKGNRYVRARPNEKASLIIDGKHAGLEPVRLRRFESSSVARNLKRHAREVKRGLKAQQAKRKHKQQHKKHLAKLAKTK